MLLYRPLEEKILPWSQLDNKLVLFLLRICPKTELKIMFEKTPVSISSHFIINNILSEKLNISEYKKQVGTLI